MVTRTTPLKRGFLVEPEVPRDCPADLVQLITDCLQLDPQRRPATKARDPPPPRPQARSQRHPKACPCTGAFTVQQQPSLRTCMPPGPIRLCWTQCFYRLLTQVRTAVLLGPLCAAAGVR